MENYINILCTRICTHPTHHKKNNSPPPLRRRARRHLLGRAAGHRGVRRDGPQRQQRCRGRPAVGAYNCVLFAQSIVIISHAFPRVHSIPHPNDPPTKQTQHTHSQRRASLEGAHGVQGQPPPGPQSIGGASACYRSHAEEWTGWKVRACVRACADRWWVVWARAPATVRPYKLRNPIHPTAPTNQPTNHPTFTTTATTNHTQAMAEAQAQFLRWTREASGFEARRREVDALLLQQERRVRVCVRGRSCVGWAARDATRHDHVRASCNATHQHPPPQPQPPTPQDPTATASTTGASLGAAVDHGMAQMAQAVTRLAGAAEGMAAAARDASVALMRILKRAGMWVGDWGFVSVGFGVVCLCSDGSLAPPPFPLQ